MQREFFPSQKELKLLLIPSSVLRSFLRTSMQKLHLFPLRGNNPRGQWGTHPTTTQPGANIPGSAAAQNPPPPPPTPKPTPAPVSTPPTLFLFLDFPLPPLLRVLPMCGVPPRYIGLVPPIGTNDPKSPHPFSHASLVPSRHIPSSRASLPSTALVPIPRCPAPITGSTCIPTPWLVTVPAGPVSCDHRISPPTSGTLPASRVPPSSEPSLEDHLLAPMQSQFIHWDF